MGITLKGDDDISKDLSQYTNARVGLPRSGTSIKTKAILDFKLAHAGARDAVHALFDKDQLTDFFKENKVPSIVLKSAVKDRIEYLKRPDLGRILSEDSKIFLDTQVFIKSDVGFIISDGLSPKAINTHCIPFLKEFFNINHHHFSLSPFAIVDNGRVAIGDQIGYKIHSEISVVLIGERPGLSSQDSMGIYLTYHPVPGKTDEERNCISNIHSHGLSYKIGVEKLFYLIQESLTRRISGVGLKDNYGALL